MTTAMLDKPDLSTKSTVSFVLPDENLALTLSDRCDSTFHPYIGNKIDSKRESCTAAATVRIILSNGLLLMCGHHYTENEEVFSKIARRIDDKRVKEVKNRHKGSHNS